MAEAEPTSEKLARALREAGAPRQMVRRARRGEYDDYRSPHAMPIHMLVEDARAAGLTDIAERAIAGEFDGTREESEAWAASPEGQETFRKLMGPDRG